MTQTSEEHAALRIASGSKPFVEPLRLGERLKQIRLANQWTLEEVGQRTGLARSTLSKIENDQVSPTFSVVQKLITGLNIDLPQLLTPPKRERYTMGRRDLTRRGKGQLHPTPTYEHELLGHQLAQKRMIPFKTIVKARSFDEYQQWVRHDGEEFLIVLYGEILLYTEFYSPLKLIEGDSIYFDSDMGHALVSISENDATVLSVCTRGDIA
ncbi:helix-turn-helix domain-containing protein [Halomonas dongshanensis]|uniref:XRE family transcriptional regulator n=1 Tax=Halomonas dongshanensis TaxID=2890835 RepID=A0ABT2EG89_9GAMM|nr:XRE family transcriptional regulator [Halomonas dongshanensis]MCS2610585.1 XRE family transcriptional regulator [Halomonas dongshanensis]